MRDYKPGEVFKLDGNLYQCIDGSDCGECAFRDSIKGCTAIKDIGQSVVGRCGIGRDDAHCVHFKKITEDMFNRAQESNVNSLSTFYYGVYIIKVYQTGEFFYPTVEDYEGKKILSTRDISSYFIIDSVYKSWKSRDEACEDTKWVLSQINFNKIHFENNTDEAIDSDYIAKKIGDAIADSSCSQLVDNIGLKPFSIELAKEGKPVCTRDGRDVRIVCFDMENEFPIVALVKDKDGKENAYTYPESGKWFIHSADLFIRLTPHTDYVA